MRSNRRLNHTIHMAAVTQIAHKHSQGHAYYQRKLAEGKTPAEARRALKRKISVDLAAAHPGESRSITQQIRARPVPPRRERTTAHQYRPASPSCAGP
jgi:hypothetical protein